MSPAPGGPQACVCPAKTAVAAASLAPGVSIFQTRRERNAGAAVIRGPACAVQGSGMKVLFVDDEPRVLNAIQRALLVAGMEWDARFADGGEAALAAIAAEHFDVVVSDMRMPRVDGAAVLNA